VVKEVIGIVTFGLGDGDMKGGIVLSLEFWQGRLVRTKSNLVYFILPWAPWGSRTLQGGRVVERWREYHFGVRVQ
jgi:hypothetical protein